MLYGTTTAVTEGAGGWKRHDHVSHETAYKRPTREELHALKRALGYESVQQVKALLKRKPEIAEAALQAFRYSGDAEALLEQLQAQDGYQQARADMALAADRQAATALRARFEDETLALLLILAALEW